jgi:hypothetical protein
MESSPSRASDNDITGKFPLLSEGGVLEREQYQRLGLRIITYSVFLVALTFSWSDEQPSSLHTLVVVLTVLLLGFLFVTIAARRGYVLSRGQWLFAFALKMSLTLLMTTWFWVTPLGPEHLRDTVGGVQDSNIYDYNGKRLAEVGLTNPNPGLQSVWLDYGVTRYIAVIYSLFGPSVFYVALFNALASLGGILCLLATFVAIAPDKVARWQKIRFAMLLPFGSYYDATPAKEAPTSLLFYLALFLCVLVVFGRKRGFLIPALLTLTCILLAIFRLNVLLLIACGAFAGLLFARGALTKRLLIATAMVAAMAILVPMAYQIVIPGREMSFEGMVDQLIGLSRRVELAQDALDVKQASANPLVGYVGNIVVPHNAADFFTLAPLRTVIWLYLPFPFVFPQWKQIGSLPSLLPGDYRAYVSITETLCARLSALTMIAATPGVFALFRKRTRPLQPGLLFLLVAFVVTALLISNLQVFETRRYRVLLEPLFLALSMGGYAYRNPGRHARWIWPLFIVPAAVAYIATGS